MTRTSQIFLFLGSCALIACGGDDDDGIVIADSGPSVDAEAVGCGDYEEANDSSNNTLIGEEGEASGITFAAGDSKVVCGVIDPEQADEAQGFTDIDGIDFEGSDGAPMRVVLRTDAAAAEDLGGLVLLLQVSTPQGFRNAAGGGFVDGYALATTQASGTGPWRLVVVALPGETPLAAPFDYEVEIVDRIPCAAAEGEPAFTEANDGAQSRRNDMVTITWANDPSFALTGPTTDNPEPTEQTLADGTAVHLAGSSANRTATDDYRDKDSFAVTVGDDVNEIDVVLSWPDEANADLDSLIFPVNMAEPELSGGTGAFGGTAADENYTARVMPGGDIAIWVGTYNDTMADPQPTLPAAYDVTICPRNFAP